MAAAYVVPKIESKVWPKLFQAMPSLSGKVVAITGCTSGTGLCAAIGSAKKGALVLLLNRPSERATAALSKVQAEGKAEHVDCDLQDFASVRQAGEAIRSKFPEGIDVLCNNAGVMALDDYSTKDGFDVQMQVNHLSHFLLTKELMPLLEKKAAAAGEARVVNHSSIARFGVPLEGKYFESGLGGQLGGNNPDMAAGEGNWRRYHMTKLANAVFTYALKSKLERKGSKVKAMVAHPGLAATELQATTVNSGGWDAGSANNFMQQAQSPEDGAAGIFRGIADPEARSGDFFGPPGKSWAGEAERIDVGAEPGLYDEAQMELLWAQSVKAVGGDIF
eukprot:CAMPEP_0196724522 /NCGR_PEP_ID=MMETSP1091-20130531/6330_1 /TAXON_ID=302021 /ORGANISM="Rhodomonas sp., Strain CCMP768" /LENGTH=333 /DNA_ID=CAMNT_0042066645 /DNA_START=50 /DNA_END=1051 /DNA_ORIENTATION=+